MSSCLHGTFSILSFFLIFQSFIDIAHAWDGVVVRVVDGDTLIVAPKDAKQPELLRISVRLYGIDAPELSQPGGKESKAALERLARQGAAVDIIPVEADRYDRAVGVVMFNGVSLNIEQIRNGQAWVYDKYCKARFCGDWQRIEQQARAVKFGLWREASPVPPWEWRKMQKHSKVSGTQLSFVEQILNFHAKRLGQRGQRGEPALENTLTTGTIHRFSGHTSHFGQLAECESLLFHKFRQIAF